MNANLITIADQAKSILGNDFRPSTDWKLYQSVARNVAKKMLEMQEECLRMKEYIESICCECDNCLPPVMCSRCEALGITEQTAGKQLG